MDVGSRGQGAGCAAGVVTGEGSRSVRQQAHAAPADGFLTLPAIDNLGAVAAVRTNQPGQVELSQPRKISLWHCGLTGPTLLSVRLASASSCSIRAIWKRCAGLNRSKIMSNVRPVLAQRQESVRVSGLPVALRNAPSALWNSSRLAPAGVSRRSGSCLVQRVRNLVITSPFCCRSVCEPRSIASRVRWDHLMSGWTGAISSRNRRFASSRVQSGASPISQKAWSSGSACC